MDNDELNKQVLEGFAYSVLVENTPPHEMSSEVLDEVFKALNLSIIEKVNVSTRIATKLIAIKLEKLEVECIENNEGDIEFVGLSEIINKTEKLQ